METLAYLELLFNDTSNPCYFADLDTHEMIFINKPMEKKLKHYGDYQGKKCYQLIHHRETPCNFCPMETIEPGKFIEQSIFNEVTKGYHRANSTLMTIHDKKICACKYFVSVAQEKVSRKVISYDKAIAQCMEILNSNKLEASLSQFLSLIGNFYQCESSYIYELDQEAKKITNKYSWVVNDEAEIVPEITESESVEQFARWLETVDENGIVEIDKRKKAFTDDSVEHKILSLYGARDLVIFPIKNKTGETLGFLGFSNRRAKNLDSRLLLTIARFVQENYSKQIIDSEFQAVQAVQYIDDQTGFYNRKRYIQHLNDLEQSPPTSLGVLFVSLSSLRRINEVHGYDKGDAHITLVATMLEEYFPGSFYRITGEEFISFMENSDQRKFKEWVQILTEYIEDNEIPITVGSAWGDSKCKVLQLVGEADTNAVTHH